MKLFKTKLDKRIALGKTIGFIGGIIGFIALPFVFNDVDIILKVGLLFWYTTLGVIVGVFGVWKTIPLLNIKVPYWFRGIWLGAWMNFILALLIYDKLAILLNNSNYAGWSPYWIILEGAIFGLFVDYLATKYIGEGKELMK